MRLRTRQKKLIPPELSLDKLGVGILLYAYAVLLGACYLFSFWRPFGFNIFPYMGVQDYVSAPLNRVVVVVAMPLIVAAVFVAGEIRDRRFLQTVMLVLVAVYGLGFAYDFYKGFSVYLATDFRFANETSVLVIAAMIFSASVALSVYNYRSLPELPVQIFALVLAQSSAAMAAGYADGKSVYNGALQVHFLENRELCEQEGVRDWVFLGAFSGQTFFMNTIDKRLCITDEKKLRLVSRQVREQRR